MLQNRIGALIPAYFPPTSANFTTIINQKNAHPNVPIAVVINITGSGVGDSAQAAYTTLMDNLRSAGVIVLGYVYTNFGEEASVTVQGEIDKWWNFYNAGTSATTRRVHGIFFAAMSNQTAKQSYYSNLHTYARVTKGFFTTAGSAGTAVPTSFLASTCADTIVVYEGAGVPLPSNYQQYDANADNNVAVIPYGIASINTAWMQQMSAYAGWMYMTNDSGANPYDTLPPYFASFMTELDAIGAGSSTGSNTDTFGIKKVYHTRAGGEEWYVDLSSPGNDPRFQNEPPLTRNADGSYSAQGSSPDYYVRLEAWSPAYADTTQRINAKWRNVEITGYLKLDDQFADSTYLFQLYSRGGHHGSADPCEGSALKSRLWRHQSGGWLSAGFTKEVCHNDGYVNNPANLGVVTSNTVPHTGTDPYSKWIGIKHVIYNVVESGNTYTKQEQWVDINVQDSNGNLVINNNWKFLTSHVDRGNWCNNNGGCGSCRPACTILTAPGGNTTSGSANFNRNLCAWRSDGQRFRFMQLTAREIDPERPASGDPAPPPSTDPASAFDNFGTRKVYATKPGGNEWYIAATPTTDSRYNANITVTKNSDGTFKASSTITPQQYLINVYQPNGYNSGVTATNAQNHGTCASRGYMQDSADWRNVEMSGYFRVISETSSGAGEICLFVRGGRHTDPQPNCEGSSMKGFINTAAGATRFAKEQFHISYNYVAYSNQVNSTLVNRWIGFKYVCYNLNVSGNNVVKQEIYVDNNNDNTWVKVDERADAGGWGISGKTCLGFSDDQLIIWGGPIACFRFDAINNVDFKSLSVREIDADAISQQPPPDQGGGSCGT
jgi:hypothetical protein